MTDTQQTIQRNMISEFAHLYYLIRQRYLRYSFPLLIRIKRFILILREVLLKRNNPILAENKQDMRISL